MSSFEPYKAPVNGLIIISDVDTEFSKARSKEVWLDTLSKSTTNTAITQQDRYNFYHPSHLKDYDENSWDKKKPSMLQ